MIKLGGKSVITTFMRSANKKSRINPNMSEGGFFEWVACRLFFCCTVCVSLTQIFSLREAAWKQSSTHCACWYFSSQRLRKCCLKRKFRNKHGLCQRFSTCGVHPLGAQGNKHHPPLPPVKTRNKRFSDWASRLTLATCNQRGRWLGWETTRMSDSSKTTRHCLLMWLMVEDTRWQCVSPSWIAEECGRNMAKGVCVCCVSELWQLTARNLINWRDTSV